MNEIVFAGGSHYGLGGYRSLFPYFDKIYLIKDNPQNILKEKRRNDEIIDSFDSVDCKYVFLCGYADFITKQQLEKKTYINIHGALLPKYRGMHPTFYAIMNGEEELGITFHLVNEYMDAGDIISQFSFSYTGQSIQSINDKIDHLVYKHAGTVLHDYSLGRIEAKPQDNDSATFGAKRNLDDCYLDFYMENQMMERFFKALTHPYPHPMLQIKGKRYEIEDHLIVEKRYFGPVGRVINIDHKGVWIKIKDGYLIIKKVKAWGEKEGINLCDLVKIGYRFVGGGYELESLDDNLYNYLKNNMETLPKRIQKFVALYYPDARIRKIALKYNHVIMGEGSYSNPGVVASAASAAPVIIGKNVSIAPNVCFITQSEPNNSHILKNNKYVSKYLIKKNSIVVEDDAWIGANVTILPGIHIGKGAIVGAGAVVITDVEEFSVYAGIPAKKIRTIK